MEDVLNEKTTIEQQVVTGKAESVSLIQDTASIIGNIETPANACEMVTEVCSFDVKHKPVIDTDTRLCEDVNKSSEGFQPICENSEKVQQTSVKTDEQESNASNDLSPKPRFDDNATDKREKPLITQAILAGSVGAALLVSSVVAYILKMYAIAVIGWIVGLACIGFALYNIINPNTKLEKVEEQSITAHPPLKAI
ncbi:hypothetical protein [Wolbachia endosymbiont (group A) of Bibio marci]|uniref:hypothetical protein n=1 Tax=Wolbachia endosymbiont (group A) of Bibio marci TaxID=2953987 RepID=UPI0022323AA5|nr:hypothetical protein [Wolbachia endosymbiont (group A) of Bibio marci]